MKTNAGHKKFRPQHYNRKQTAFRFYNSTSETLPFKKTNSHRVLSLLTLYCF